MQIISKKQMGSWQGYPLLEFSSVHRILKQMGFTMLELGPQKSTFCLPNHYQKSQYQNITSIEMNRQWLILQFSIKFKANNNKITPVTRQLVNKIQGFNQNESRLLTTSYNQSANEIKSISKKIEPNLAHIKLISNVIKQFQAIEKYILADSCQENNKKQKNQKLSNLRQIMEKKRTQRQKSSKTTLYPIQSSKVAGTKLSQFYQESKKKNQTRFKKKQTDQPYSLRFVQLLYRNAQIWSQLPPDHLQIELITSKYRIYNLGSVHKSTHQHLKEAIYFQKQSLERADQNIADIVSVEKEYITRQSHLIVKHSTSGNYQASINQLKILSFLRHCKCRSINSFYVAEDIEKIFRENIPFQIFSDYHTKELNMNIMKKKNSLMILEALAEGLYFLGTKKLLHRDLKPENILLTTQYQPKIIDFGSAYFSNEYRGTRIYLTQALKTSRYYNIFYSQMPESITDLYNRYEFETSPFYDIHALGKLIDRLFEAKQTREQLGHYFYECIEWLVGTCTHPNPQDRPEALDIYIYVRYLIQLIVTQ